METHGKPWKSHGKPMFSQKNDLLMVGFPHLFICLEDRYAQITNLFMKKCGRITIVIIPPVMWKKSVLRVMKNGEHNQQWGINESCMLFENKGKCHIPTSLSFLRPSQFAAALSVPIDTSFSGPCAGLCREGQRESGAPRGEECLLLGTDLENIYV